MRVEDKLTVRLGRDGGLQAFELSGLLTLRVADEKFGRIKIFLDNNDQRGIQLQTHPNIDKELFRNKSQIGLKNPAKPFPMNTDVGVLKWRYTTQDETAVPLTSEKFYYSAKEQNNKIFFYFSSQLLAIREWRWWLRREH